MNKAIATVCFAFFAILIYMGWVVTTYKPDVIQNTTGPLPKKETRSDYELPKLSEKEIAVTNSIIKDTIKQAEDISESKSVEQMIQRVDDILQGKIKQDTLSFNYTVKAPEILNPWAN